MFTDACDDTAGGSFGHDWFYFNWDQDLPQASSLHKNEKEILAVVLVAQRWSKYWVNKRIVLHSDNTVTVGRAKRIWYLSPMRAAKVQASLRIRAVLPEPPLLAHTSSESRGTFRQKARSLAPLNGWACAVKVCHDGMLEDTNSLGAAHCCLCE